METKQPLKIPLARQYRWHKSDYASDNARNVWIAKTMDGQQLGYTYQNLSVESQNPCWVWVRDVAGDAAGHGYEWIEALARKAVNDIAIKAGYLPVNPKYFSMI